MIKRNANTRLRRAIVLLRAASRLSPRMAAFMLRRSIRNRLARQLPDLYLRRLTTLVGELPKMTDRRPTMSAVRQVAEFYSAEYGHQIDSVSRGRICLHGREVDFGAPSLINWKLALPEEGDHQMWRIKLAHMGFLGPMLSDGGSEHHRAVRSIVNGFRRLTSPTDPGAFAAYWFPYAVSHRILSIGSGLLLAREKNSIDPEMDAFISDFLRENVAFLLDNVEYELFNNHMERNLSALSLYFSYVHSVPQKIATQIERDISALVAETILDDGTQIERSPMYQGLSLVSLAVMAQAPFISDELRSELARKVDASHRAFAMLCHPDGEVALFNDSWHQEVPRWTGPSPIADGRSLLSQGGYARLSHHNDVCLLDAGAIGPSWNPGHGHADFLAVEITLAGHRLIVDPGTSRYNTGPDRASERSAAAHNGPVWTGYEPIEFLGCFKVGRLARAELLPTDTLSELAIGGIFRDGPGCVGRIIHQFPGLGFLVADQWSSPAPRGKVSWLIPESWQIRENGSGLILRSDVVPEAVIDVLVGGGEHSVHPSFRACHYGRRSGAYELRLQPAKSNGQSLLCWIGHGPAPTDAREIGSIMLDKLHQFVGGH